MKVAVLQAIGHCVAILDRDQGYNLANVKLSRAGKGLCYIPTLPGNRKFETAKDAALAWCEANGYTLDAPNFRGSKERYCRVCGGDEYVDAGRCPACNGSGKEAK